MISVSILLPTYNGGKYIHKAIQSVLDQSFTDWELLVIDDASTDNTPEIVKRFTDPRIVYMRNESNSGIQKTLTVGLGSAKGKYIARIDDDDIWILRDKLFLQVSFMEKNSEYVLLGTDAKVINIFGEEISVNIMPHTDKEIRSKMLSKNCFLHSTIMARATCVQALGGYSENKNVLHAEDYDLWLRLGLQGKVANLTLFSTALTSHAQSLTSKNRVRQAKHILWIILQYKNAYPGFIQGLLIAFLRYSFFVLFAYIPFKGKWFHRLQRWYKK